MSELVGPRSGGKWNTTLKCLDCTQTAMRSRWGLSSDVFTISQDHSVAMWKTVQRVKSGHKGEKGLERFNFLEGHIVCIASFFKSKEYLLHLKPARAKQTFKYKLLMLKKKNSKRHLWTPSTDEMQTFMLFAFLPFASITMGKRKRKSIQ